MITFNDNVAPQLSRYVEDMKRKVQTSTEDGVFPFDMSNYEFVKAHVTMMLVRLKGVNKYGQMVPIMPPGSKGDGNQGYRDKTIEILERWIADGMPENSVIT